MRIGWLLILLIHGLLDFTLQSTLTNKSCDSSEEFDCGTGPLGCIPIDWKCDNVKDCYNGADEIGCPPNKCKKGELICLYSFKNCVDGSYKCDGINDCLYGSDEKHCKYNSRRAGVPPPFNYGDLNNYKYDGGYDKNGCLPGFGLCSADDTCIPNRKFCDGVEDCRWDKEDERNCTMQEPVKDIDHCFSKKRACHHFCENLKNGSFVCSCAKGYELEEDDKTCRRTNPSEGSLLLCRFGKISKKPLEDYSETKFTAFREVEEHIVAFDYLRRDDKLFMALCKSRNCEAVKVVVEENGNSTILVENHPTITHLAVDWIGGNLFITEEGIDIEKNDTSTISVCTMDFKFCHRLIELEMKRRLLGFAIHPMRGLIFWDTFSRNEHDPRSIMMANMDGTEIQTLVETSEQSYAIAIDYANNYLFFQHLDDRFIRRVNIDTKKTEILAQNLRFTPATMAYHNGLLYLSDGPLRLRILDVSRKNARVHSILGQTSHNVRDMVVNGSLHQPEPSYNPCKEIECPWICVIGPGFTAKCLCPDGYNPSLNGTTCIPFDTMSEDCKKGVACLNGGVCREVFNKTRIVCDCQESYDGMYCERRKPMVSAKTILFTVALLLLIATGYGIYCLVFHKRNKKIGSKATDLLTKLMSS